MRMLQKKYIGIVLLLLVAVSASAQKAERDYIRKGCLLYTSDAADEL